MNKKKHNIDMALSISGIAVGALIFIVNLFAIIALMALSSIAGTIDGTTGGLLAMFILIVGFVTQGLAAALLVLSIRICMLTKSNRGAGKGITIAMLVICALMAIMYIINIADGNTYSIFWLIFFGGLVTLCILSLRLSNIPDMVTTDAPVQQPYAQQNLQTTDDKIAELKRLQELNIISQQQYDEALSKIINEAANT